ncbi:MAG: DUF1223 domain-containing protein [Caulobacteraceae bacterium]|nr:DUF1223 domain-containing protein [Caulobacter sp.]
MSGTPASELRRAAAAALLVGALAASPAAAADAAHPEVVELFQSQGCSSCPPANANVMAIADRPDILALSFQVTYWDQLGWKDTFAEPAYTARQWDYARAFHRAEVATPEVVVNGRADVVGSNRAQLDALLHQADRGDGGPRVSAEGGRVTVSGAPAGARVMLVRYDPHIVQVAIRRGENGGKTLPHRNVVRQLAPLGAVAGAAPQSFALPAADLPGLKTAVLVQAAPGGPILAAARV